MGCYFSINRRSLEHHAGIVLVRSLPGDRLLTETDGPFTEVGTRKSEPRDVVDTAQQIARDSRTSYAGNATDTHSQCWSAYSRSRVYRNCEAAVTLKGARANQVETEVIVLKCCQGDHRLDREL